MMGYVDDIVRDLTILDYPLDGQPLGEWTPREARRILERQYARASEEILRIGILQSIVAMCRRDEARIMSQMTKAQREEAMQKMRRTEP